MSNEIPAPEFKTEFKTKYVYANTGNISFFEHSCHDSGAERVEMIVDGVHMHWENPDNVKTISDYYKHQFRREY